MPKKEPLLTTPLPDYPWQIVRSDLFEISGEHYLFVMDYFSRLTSTTSAAVITSLKSIFMRHGILEVLQSDNNPQYAFQQFLMFTESYRFQHSTSSLRYPQSNGQAEQTVKQQSSDRDPLLNYCVTPLPWCRHSPAELLMGRRLRTHFLNCQRAYNRHGHTRRNSENKPRSSKPDRKGISTKGTETESPMPFLTIPSVWITSEGEQATDSPRSYLVETPTGTVRRNHIHLNVNLSQPSKHLQTQAITEKNTDTQARRRIVTRSQAGTTVKPPKRLCA